MGLPSASTTCTSTAITSTVLRNTVWRADTAATQTAERAAPSTHASGRPERIVHAPIMYSQPGSGIRDPGSGIREPRTANRDFRLSRKLRESERITAGIPDPRSGVRDPISGFGELRPSDRGPRIPDPDCVHPSPIRVRLLPNVAAQLRTSGWKCEHLG